MNDVELLDSAAQVTAVRAVLAGLHPLDEVNTRWLVERLQTALASPPELPAPVYPTGAAHLVGGAGFESPYPAAVSQVSDTGWLLLHRMVFWISPTECVVVPAGTETDFASVPATLRSMFPPYGAYTAAVILHDYLWRVLVPAGVLTYREADALLRVAMRTLGVSAVRRRSMWAAVRWGALLARRGGHLGWWRDAPAVVMTSVLLLPLVVGPALTNGSSMLVFKLAELAVGAGEQLVGRR